MRVGVVAAALGLVLTFACGCSQRARREPTLRERAASLKERLKKDAPEADLQIGQGHFEGRDRQGRLVIDARVASWQAIATVGSGIKGPVTLREVSCRLFREGRPSTWLKTPLAVWDAGVLRARRSVQAGSTDGRVACRGAAAEWQAKADLLTVEQARCQMKERGRSELNAEGARATWQGGLLTMPAGVRARTADGRRTLRARRLTWRPAESRIVASGEVQATGPGSLLQGETMLADTRLRRIEVVSFPPGGLASRGRGRVSRSWLVPGNSVERASANVVPVRPPLAARGGAARAAPRKRPSLMIGEWTLEADRYGYADLSAPQSDFEATGDVVLKGPRGTMRMPKMTARVDQKRGLLVARATGGVRMESAGEQGKSLTARGREAVYEPPEDRMVLTGGAEAIVTSPELAEPARLTGDRVELRVRGRTATIFRTPQARVQFSVRPKKETAPFDLTADQVTYDGSTDRVTAVGRPVMKNPRGTLTADRIWFNLAPKADNIMVARGEGNVALDARWEQPNPLQVQATSRTAEYLRAENRITLEGDVQGSQVTPDSSTPRRFSGDRMTLNLETRQLTMEGSPAQVRTVPKPRRKSEK